MKKSYLAMAALAVLMSACSADNDDIQISDSNLRVYGSIDQVRSRVSDDGTAWSSGDQIGITGGNYTNMCYTTTNGDGNFSGSTIKATESATSYTAYYPFAGTEGTAAGEIEFDVTDATQNVDFMWAQASASKSNLNMKFNFEHKMSRVALTFTYDESTPTTLTYSLSGMPVSGKFNTETGAVTTDAAGSEMISGTATIDTPVAFILPSANTSTQITIGITMDGGNSYVGTITPDLAPGTQYNYTVALKDKAATVQSSSVTGWTNQSNTDVDANEGDAPAVPNTLEVGDFLLKDGTVVDKNDDLTGLDVAGVVFYVGSVMDDNATLEIDYPDCTNGLAIALNNINSEAMVMNTAKNTFTYDIVYSNVPTILDGYENTIMIQEAQDAYDTAYAADSEQTAVSDPGTATLLAAVKDYRDNNPVTNASVWYIPSYGEMDQITTNYETVKTSVEKATGSLDQYTHDVKTDGEFYYTSSMRNATYAWGSTLSTWDTPKDATYTRRSNKGWFRLAIAF